MLQSGAIKVFVLPQISQEREAYAILFHHILHNHYATSMHSD